MRRAVVAISACSLCACQLLLFDLEGAPGRVDGARDAASPRDAALGPANDGSAVGDGATGDGATGDSGTCRATFCDDFDHGPLGARWDETVGLDAAPIARLEGAAFTSPPYSFHARLLGNDNPPDVHLRKYFALPSGRLRVDVAMRVEALSPSNDFIVFECADLPFTVELVSRGTDVEVEQCPIGAGECTSASLPGALDKRFVRYEITLDLQGGRRVSVVRDGAALVPLSLPPSTPPTGGYQCSVQIGIPYLTASVPVEVYFDDFTAVVEP